MIELREDLNEETLRKAVNLCRGAIVKARGGLQDAERAERWIGAGIGMAYVKGAAAAISEHLENIQALHDALCLRALDDGISLSTWYGGW